MRVLFLCHRFPYPPRRGGKIRPFNIIRHLSERGHEVTVASLVRDRSEAEAGRGLLRHCAHYIAERISPASALWRMMARVPTAAPSSFGNFFSPALMRRVQSLLGASSFDLIFVHCSSAAQYVENVNGVPKILDFGDMDSQKWRVYAQFQPWPLAAGYWLEGVKLERREARQARQFDLCTCTTREELASLEQLNAARHTGWFPNGVDLEYFAPSSEKYDPSLISFVGRMDYFPNQQAVLDFCRDVWPLLRAARDDLRLQIVGAEPPSTIRKLGEVAGVTVTGSVDDVRPYVRRSALTIAPLRIARGTQNKILESLAMGVPVVASPQAARGVDAEADEHLLIAATPEENRAAILQLVDDGRRRSELAESGRRRMQDRHTWSASMTRMDALLEGCFARRAQAAN
jgi:sugar transferase (PEP-CTERM/EpsH1 system associated)